MWHPIWVRYLGTNTLNWRLVWTDWVTLAEDIPNKIICYSYQNLPSYCMHLAVMHVHGIALSDWGCHQQSFTIILCWYVAHSLRINNNNNNRGKNTRTLPENWRGCRTSVRIILIIMKLLGTIKSIEELESPERI